MEALTSIFDGATAFGVIALASVHVHVAVGNWLKMKHITGIETRVKQLENVGCHVTQLQGVKR